MLCAVVMIKTNDLSSNMKLLGKCISQDDVF